MLECGRNFEGTIEFQCKSCNVIDDEEHRLNHCILFKDLNFRDCTQEIPFSTDIASLRRIIVRISQVWNVKTAHDSINNNLPSFHCSHYIYSVDLVLIFVLLFSSLTMNCCYCVEYVD